MFVIYKQFGLSSKYPYNKTFYKSIFHKFDQQLGEFRSSCSYLFVVSYEKFKSNTTRHPSFWCFNVYGCTVYEEANSRNISRKSKSDYETCIWFIGRNNLQLSEYQLYSQLHGLHCTWKLMDKGFIKV